MHTHTHSHTRIHTHTPTHSHLCVQRQMFGEIPMKQLPDHSPEVPQLLWKDHPDTSRESSGWLRRVLSEAPCAVTTEVPPASQKSQAGAHQLISCTSEPAPPNRQETSPHVACPFQAHTTPLPTAARPAGQAGSLLSSKEGSVYYCCRFDADPKRT